MPLTVGATGQVYLNGYTYWILANTYEDSAPRLRKATPRADGAEDYVDFGLGKRTFKFTVLALNDLTNYDGSPYAMNAVQVRSTLDGSYALVNQTMLFVDPANTQWTVRFDHLAWRLPDPRTQTNPNGPSWHAEVELVQG